MTPFSWPPHHPVQRLGCRLAENHGAARGGPVCAQRQQDLHQARQEGKGTLPCLPGQQRLRARPARSGAAAGGAALGSIRCWLQQCADAAPPAPRLPDAASHCCGAQWRRFEPPVLSYGTHRRPWTQGHLCFPRRKGARPQLAGEQYAVRPPGLCGAWTGRERVLGVLVPSRCGCPCAPRCCAATCRNPCTPPCPAAPQDTPGLSFGKPERKMGWNAQPTTTVASGSVV